MASTLKPLSPLPTPQQPIVDQRTGLITRDWFTYLKRLDEHVREIEARLEAAEAGIVDADARLTAGGL